MLKKTWKDNFLARAARPARAARAAHRLQHRSVLKQEAPTPRSAHHLQKFKRTCKPSGTEARIAEKSLERKFLARASRPARAARAAHRLQHCSVLKQEPPTSSSAHQLQKLQKLANLRGRRRKLLKKIGKKISSHAPRARRALRALRTACSIARPSSKKPLRRARHTNFKKRNCKFSGTEARIAEKCLERRRSPAGWFFLAGGCDVALQPHGKCQILGAQNKNQKC